jgi:hypothetical protein
MQILKREISLLLASCALVVACVLAWGSPFLAVAESSAVQNQSQKIPVSQLSTFTGTIVNEGGRYVLCDDSDKDYKLDDMVRAKAFQGKMVTVVGLWEEKTDMIRVESIAPVGA